MGKILIVTGLSGAGKTEALKSIEDTGYYCIDNLPVEIVDKFVSLIFSEKIEKVAIGIDIRQSADFDSLKAIFKKWKKNNQEYKILFLDASEKTLVGRYKATKRKHPLEGKMNLLDAIKDEKSKTLWLKNQADYVINTDKYTNYDLKNKLAKTVKFPDRKKIDVSIISFGYKKGLPIDADLVFDVRFLPNPFYVDTLRQYDGTNKKVINYIEKDKETKKSINKIFDLINHILPLYKKEGKSKVVMAFGCTGGKHRSVYMAHKLYKTLSKKSNYILNIEDRDIK